MKFEEKTISSKYVYNGKVLDVKRDDVVVSNGHKSIREVVEHSGGVVVLALKGDKIITVEQYRYPLKQTSVELPAGKLEIGENPDDAAKRELLEETGYIAKNWKSLGYIYTTPGFCNEKLYLYMATDLEYVKKCPDEDEILEANEIDLDLFYNLILEGTVNDSKTICALFRARSFIND